MKQINARITWRDESKLLDLDYVDDIVLINRDTEEMQWVLDSLIREGKKFAQKLMVQRLDL